MLRLLQCQTRRIINTILMCLKWLVFGRRGSVVGSWLLDLTLMYYVTIENLASLVGEYQTVVKVVGLSTLLWILVYPLLLLLLHSLNDSTPEDLESSETKSSTE